jgi:hypothetical protein
MLELCPLSTHFLRSSITPIADLDIYAFESLCCGADGSFIALAFID